MFNVAKCNHLGKVNLMTGLLASSRTLGRYAFYGVDAESSRGIYPCLLCIACFARLIVADQFALKASVAVGFLQFLQFLRGIGIFAEMTFIHT